MAEAEVVLRDATAAKFVSARVVTETPADLVGDLPVIEVNVVGGSGEFAHTFTNPRVDWDCYAATRAEARTLAYAVREWVRTELEGITASGASVAAVLSDSEPSSTPYVNTNVRRFTYTAQLRLHNH